MGDFTEAEVMLTMRPNFRSIMPSTTDLISYRLPFNRMAPLINGLDTVLAQMIGLDVGHDTYIGPVVAQPRTHDTSPRGLQHCKINGCVRKDDVCRPWACHIATGNLLSANPDPFRGGCAHGFARGCRHHMGDHEGYGGFPVGARDR